MRCLGVRAHVFRAVRGWAEENAQKNDPEQGEARGNEEELMVVDGSIHRVGGREAWEVAGLPEAQVDVQDW